MGRIWIPLFGVSLLLLTGCRGWGRVATGGAYDLGDRNGHSGNVVSVDGAIGVQDFKPFGMKRPFPFAVHTSADAILAPDRKSYGWGTGVVFYREPRPVSGYLIGGTSLHFDDIDGRFSFGNVSPYGELGVMASVPSRYDDGGDGLMVTLGISGASYINYLSKDDTVDAFVLVKLGIAWEKSGPQVTTPQPGTAARAKTGIFGF